MDTNRLLLKSVDMLLTCSSRGVNICANDYLMEITGKIFYFFSAFFFMCRLQIFIFGVFTIIFADCSQQHQGTDIRALLFLVFRALKTKTLLKNYFTPLEIAALVNKMFNAVSIYCINVC